MLSSGIGLWCGLSSWVKTSSVLRFFLYSIHIYISPMCVSFSPAFLFLMLVLFVDFCPSPQDSCNHQLFELQPITCSCFSFHRRQVNGINKDKFKPSAFLLITVSLTSRYFQLLTLHCTLGS